MIENVITKYNGDIKRIRCDANYLYYDARFTRITEERVNGKNRICWCSSSFKSRWELSHASVYL